jgi:hypothetical protein
METDVNSIRQCETVTGAANNRPRLNVVDPAPWRFTNSSSFEIIWISHEFWIYGIQLVLISGVNFYFVSRKETIVEVLTIQSLYCSFICFLRTIYLTDHFIYLIDHFIYFSNQIFCPLYFNTNANPTLLIAILVLQIKVKLRLNRRMISFIISRVPTFIFWLEINLKENKVIIIFIISGILYKQSKIEINIYSKAYILLHLFVWELL